MEPRAELLFPTIVWKHVIKQDLNAMRQHIYTVKEQSEGVNISNVGGWQSDHQDISRASFQIFLSFIKHVLNHAKMFVY